GREAVGAGVGGAGNVGYLNHKLASEVREPIQYGIGIHAGEVIVGDIGFRGHTVFTALGDAVNVASRLQDLTKELDCRVVVSEEVCKTRGSFFRCAHADERCNPRARSSYDSTDRE